MEVSLTSNFLLHKGCSLSIQSGFLLTRQARDVSGKTLIELWLTSDQGPVQLLITGEKPLFFVHSSQQSSITKIASEHSIRFDIKQLDLTDFDSVPLSAVYCSTIKIAQQLSQLLNQHGITTYEDDIRLADRFLMERFIQGSVEFTGLNTAKGDFTQITECKCRQGEYSPKLNVVSLDIECSEKGVLYSVGLDSPMDSRVIMIGDPEEAETPIEWVRDATDN